MKWASCTHCACWISLTSLFAFGAARPLDDSFRRQLQTGGCDWESATGSCVVSGDWNVGVTGAFSNAIYAWGNCTSLWDSKTGNGCIYGRPAYCTSLAVGSGYACVPIGSTSTISSYNQYVQAMQFPSTFYTCTSTGWSHSCDAPWITWMQLIGCSCDQQLSAYQTQANTCAALDASQCATAPSALPPPSSSGGGPPSPSVSTSPITAAPAPPPPPSSLSSVSSVSHGSSSAGAIAGAVVSTVVVVALAAAVAAFFLWRRRQRRALAADLDAKKDAPFSPQSDEVKDAGPASSRDTALLQTGPPPTAHHSWHLSSSVYVPPHVVGPFQAAHLAYSATPPPSKPPPANVRWPAETARDAPPASASQVFLQFGDARPPQAGREGDDASWQSPPQGMQPDSGAALLPQPPVLEDAAKSGGVVSSASEASTPLPEAKAWMGRRAAVSGADRDPVQDAPPLAVASQPPSDSASGAGVVVKGLTLYGATFDNTSELAERRDELAAAIASGKQDVHTALDFIVASRNGVVDGKYILDSDVSWISGGQAAVAFATDRFGGSWAIKFFSDHETFLQEANVYEILMREDPTGGNFVREMRGHGGDMLCEGMPMPSYIAMLRGQSLSDFIRQRKPPPLMALWLLGEVCTQVAILHNHGLVHRDLKPGNLLWLQNDNSWRVIDFGVCVREGLEAKAAFTLRFAPPELAVALSQGQTTIVAHRSADVWAVGVMAFELITGETLFPFGASSADVKAILTGSRPFPHEERPEATWGKLGRLRKLVKAMLSRDPSRRPDIAHVSKKLDQMAMSTGATTAVYRTRGASTTLGSTVSSSSAQ